MAAIPATEVSCDWHEYRHGINCGETIPIGRVFPVSPILKHYVPMPRYNEKEKIRDHYDRISPFYHSLWGEHLHHGYWTRGNETKEQAQIQLVDHLARLAEIPAGGTLLDIGCGFGASSVYLAQKFRVQATGITISPVQVEIANRAANKSRASAKFFCMDAEAMTFDDPFDIVWSVESISHYRDFEKFFASASRLLKPGGSMAITDWFKSGKLSPREHKKHIEPIEKGMLVELQTMEGYQSAMAENGLTIATAEVLNKQCAKTWDLGLNIIKNKAFWALAAEYGTEFIHYLHAFKAMKSGFASGNFVYGLIVAKKPNAAN